MAYCTYTDLLIGDIPLASKYGNGTGFVNFAADEIDSQIGHIYVTPVVFDESTPEKVATVRPSKLLLKKINVLLASGRIILDMAAGGEDNTLHAYGMSMAREALALLKQITDSQIRLTDAPVLVPVGTEVQNNSVSIRQEDSESLVSRFYTDRRGYQYYIAPVPPLPLMPYDEENVVL